MSFPGKQQEGDVQQDRQNPSQAEIYLLAGFLGSGKTTLLKRILSWEADLSGTVVLVNEFGKVGIDGDLLKEAGSDVIEMTSGCVCCSIRSELTQTLLDIWERFHPQKILIEATGVAEPESVIGVIQADPLRGRMRIRKTITVVDVKLWLGREMLGEFLTNQVGQADMVLLNKIDRVDENAVSRALGEIHRQFPGRRVIPTRYCEVDPGILWDGADKAVSGGDLLRHYHSIQLFPMGHTHHAETLGFTAFDFQETRPLDEERFRGFLEKAPFELFRIKGQVRFADRTMLVNLAGGDGDWKEGLDGWETRLAFVGWKVDSEEILKGLQGCVIP